MVERRIPKPHDLAPLMQFKKPELNAQASAGSTRRSPSRTCGRIAKRRTPKAAFDYTDGAAEAELSLARARQAFEDIEFHPAILRDVSTVDTSWDVLGGPVALPFGIAPTGFTRMMQTEGEIAGAGRGRAPGIPFTALDDGHDLDRGRARRQPARAQLVPALHVEGPRPVDGAGRAGGRGRLRHPAGHRRRAGRRRPAARQAQRHVDPAGADAAAPSLNAIPRPAWWINFLTTEPLAFASLDRWSRHRRRAARHHVRPDRHLRRPRLDQAQWPGKVVVKGVQNVEDARRLADLGVDGIILSNHGGRQLDRAPIPFHLLPEVVREVGKRREVHLDTGIMSGADIVAAIALGAQFTLIGRAYLYGLMAGGEPGVDRTIEILAEQIDPHHAAARRDSPRGAHPRPRHPARTARPGPGEPPRSDH